MDIINKGTFQYVKLENCVKNELLTVGTTDGSSVYYFSGSHKGVQVTERYFKVKEVDVVEAP